MGNTQPIAILSRAYQAVRFMCLRDFDMAPELLVNGVPYENFIGEKIDAKQKFAYVHTHLFYILMELLKNAARASVERAKLENPGKERPEISAIRVFVPEEQKRNRLVKLADRGGGMNREVLSHAFSYFFSTAKERPS